MFSMFFFSALYLELVLGFSALELGLGFLPCTVVMGALSLRYTEALITRFGAARLLAPGMALIAVGLALFALAPVDANYVRRVLPSTALLGLGAGISMPALMTVAMSGATPEDAGLASGPGEHHHADGCRAGPGGAGHRVGLAHREPGRRRRLGP